MKSFTLLWRLKQQVYARIIAAVTHVSKTCTLLFVIVTFSPILETKGQYGLQPPDDKNVTMFYSQDAIPNAEAYNRLTTRAQSDSIIKTDTVLTLDGNRTYYNQVRAENSDTIGAWSPVLKIETVNNRPSTFQVVKPESGETVKYVSGKLEIQTTAPTDADSDPLIKIIHLAGTGLDTLIQSDAATQTVYINSNRLNPNTEYTLSAEVTDGKNTTQASNSNIRFTTPIATKINEERDAQKLAIYPNPTTGTITIGLPQEIVNFKTKIYSSDGSLRHSSTNQYILNLEQLNPGTYIIQVICRNKNFIEKFVKR